VGARGVEPVSVSASEVEIREAKSAADVDAAARLMADYLRWGSEQLLEQYGVSEAPANAFEVRAKLDAYRPPAGRLLLAYWASRAVGVGALRQLPDGAAEIKRMYVAPEARSLHIGSQLLDRLIESAVEDGADVVRLDTAGFMSAAYALYRSRGLVECQAYDGTEIPPELHEDWLFFERRLAPDSSDTSGAR
jgi:ribosomal protein S18 acetylase RimI-like enzyme